MELSEYITAVRQRWRLLVLSILIGVLLSSAATLLMSKKYEAEAQIFVSTSGGQENTDQLLQGSNFTQQRVKSYAQAIVSPLVLQPVIDELGLGTTPAELATRLTTEVPLDTVLIDLTVVDEDPQRAASTANAIADELAKVVPELENATDGTSPVKVTRLSSATAPERPVSPNPLLNTLAGGLLGLALGLGLVLLKKITDTVIRTENDVAAVTDAAVIGVIPFTKSAARNPLIAGDDGHSVRAESFRTLRTNLQFVDAARHTSSIVLTSSIPGEGKSSTTANLALTLGDSGMRVCVVEADLRRPRMVDYLGLAGGAGLTNLILGDADYDDVLQPYGSNVMVLGAGPIPPNPSELLGSDAMSKVVSDLEQAFDIVIFDAPPLLPVTDAAVLSKLVDGVVVVVGADVSRKDQLRKTIDLLETVGAQLIGVVVNRVQGKNGGGTYSYYREGYEPDPVYDPSAPRSSSRPRGGGRTRVPGRQRNGLRRRG